MENYKQEFIEFMVNGAIRMKQQIKGLLDYFRVGTRGNEFKNFNAEDALDAALSNLHSSIGKNKAETRKGRCKMRTFGFVLLVFLVVVFIGGYINIGGAPIFWHIDAALGTDVLMELHHGVFFFLYGSSSRLTHTTEKLKEFQETPLGIDKKRKYRQLDDASRY